MSYSVWPHGQQPTRLLCPRDSLGKSTLTYNVTYIADNCVPSKHTEYLWKCLLNKLINRWIKIFHTYCSYQWHEYPLTSQSLQNVKFDKLNLLNSTFYDVFDVFVFLTYFFDQFFPVTFTDSSSFKHVINASFYRLPLITFFKHSHSP